MIVLYHITESYKYESIQSKGLIPNIGKRCKQNRINNIKKHVRINDTKEKLIYLTSERYVKSWSSIIKDADKMILEIILPDDFKEHIKTRHIYVQGREYVCDVKIPSKYIHRVSKEV